MSSASGVLRLASFFESWRSEGPFQTTDCRYSTAYNVSFIWAASKSLPFAVRDVTGDGLPEIMLLGPASGTLRYFTSPNFTTAYTVQLGSHMAIVL